LWTHVAHGIWYVLQTYVRTALQRGGVFWWPTRADNLVFNLRLLIVTGYIYSAPLYFQQRVALSNLQ
jgi:hypothetical protein